jgi:23S rRNA pseudouridine1911/1915/1917 synthase
MSAPLTVEVDESNAGERVDLFLARTLGMSRSRVQRLIAGGYVTVDEQAVKVSRVLHSGETLRARVEAAADDGPKLRAVAAPLAVLRESDHVLLIDKPPGLVVHPGAGSQRTTLCHRLLHHFPNVRSVGSADRPGIVHRLDVGTSGVMAVARTQTGYELLIEAFRQRSVTKRYLALVYGRLDRDLFTIDAPIGRNPRRRVLMTIRDAGRPAVSHVRVLASAAGISLLEIDLETGRTHQIRVHLKHVGHPLLGDPLYGEDRWRGLPTRLRGPLRNAVRPALHAYRLKVPTPEASHLEARSLPPNDFVQLWQSVTRERLSLPKPSPL